MQKITFDKRLNTSIFIVIAFLLVLFVVTPFQVKTFFSLISKTKDYKKKIAQVKKDISSRDQFIAQKETIAKEIMQLASKVIGSCDISGIQAYISSKAKDHGLEISEISASMLQSYKKTSKGNFYHIPISIKAKCGFHNLGRFLDEIEKSDYFLVVKRLAIKGQRPYHEVEIDIVGLTKE